MAIDSIVGGGQTTTNLSPETLALLNEILGDTVGGQTSVDVLPGGGTTVNGTGQFGEQQTALITQPGLAISGSIASGTLTIDVALPAGTGMVAQGQDDKQPEEAAAYVGGILDQYLPPTSTDPAVVSYRADFNAALAQITQALAVLGVKVSVRIVAFSQDGTQTRASANEVVLDVTSASGSSSAELLTIMMATVGAGKTLVLKGAEAAMLVGGGTVRVDGFTPARLTGDSADQNITGGGGRDTIIGGGGHDTVSGGSGADVFGFNKLQGALTITDFQVGLDKIGFGVAGINSVNDLAAKFTGLTQGTNGVTLNFGADMSITLVGVSAEQLTLDMLQYTL